VAVRKLAVVEQRAREALSNKVAQSGWARDVLGVNSFSADRALIGLLLAHLQGLLVLFGQ
jgi:hypothetical protein